MIGQTKLLNNIQVLIDREKYPRFSIFIGRTGSGRKTVAREVAKRLGVQFIVQLPDVKADTIRGMIDEAYRNPNDLLYIIPNAENMSAQAKNALLKVTEEPPNYAYFIMTAQDENSLLDTIKSRGMLFHLDTYTPTEIGEYADCDNTEDLRIITSVCETPGDVDILKKIEPTNFYNYVDMVVNNIAEVSGANAFKIASKIRFKDEEDKYDLSVFWRTFMLVCLERVNEEPLKFAKGVKITSKYLQDLNITGVNKASLFDIWILAIREAWI